MFTWQAAAIILVVLIAVVIVGGIKVISRVCEKLIPAMTIFYVLACLVLIIINGQYFLDAIGLIVVCAFTPQAAFGGAVGTSIMIALQLGCARGLFSNESGLGSSPLVASSAITRNPARQALVSMTGTFWDTVVVCAMTGLVLVSSIMKNPAIDMSTVTDGGLLTTLAFSQIPVLGPVILVVGIISFAFSTVLGWAYYGERCVEYFAGQKGLIPYRLLYVAIAAIAPVAALNLVWTIADILNALMAIPNLIAVLLLSNVIAKDTRKYLADLDAHHDESVPTIER